MNLSFLIQPFAWLLNQLFHLTGNFGLSIIGFTVLVRLLMLPLTLPALHSQRKMRELQPKLKELQKRHKGDKTALAKAQMDLYKEHNFNPLGGCIPSLIQFVPLLIIYEVLRTFIANGNNGVGSTVFLGFDLVVKDRTFILPLVAGASQFILSLMMSPGAKTPDVIPDQSKDKKIQELNKKEEGQQDMAEAMQKQMLFMAPVMTGIFALNFPSGLSLYWIASTVISIIQQYFITGPGGLVDIAKYIPFIKAGKTTPKQAKEDLSILAKALAEQSKEVKQIVAGKANKTQAHSKKHAVHQPKPSKRKKQ
jgi:YidC/Oxa1 family membrane protein insertase